MPWLVITIQPGTPLSIDETMMKWMAATLAGEKPNIDRVGLAYMLIGGGKAGTERSSRKRSYSNQRVYRSARQGGAAGLRQGSASGDQPRPLQQRAIRDVYQFRSRFHTTLGHPCR